MRAVKRIVIGLVVVVVILGLGSLLLPSTVKVERSTVVEVPPARLFTYVNSFERFNDWSPWAALDPDTRYEFTGPTEGVGAKMSWTSEDERVGTGSQEIILSEPPNRLVTKLDFGGEGTAEAYFLLEPQAENTNVTWGFETDLGYNPIARYFGLAFDGMIGPEYEKGLAALKTLAESEPEPVVLEVAEETVEQQPILFVSGKTATDGEAIGKALGEAYGKLSAATEQLGIEPVGPPIAVNIAHSDTEYEFHAAFPVASTDEIEVPEGIEKGTLPATMVLKVVHTGRYEDLPKTYEQLHEHMESSGFVPNGSSWEQYMNDPQETPPEEAITHVYYPVKPKPVE